MEQLPRWSGFYSRLMGWARGMGGMGAARPRMRLSHCTSRTGFNSLTLSSKTDGLQKGPFCFWRRGWDSNPRRAISPCWFSRPVHSTALPPLLATAHFARSVMRIQQRRGIMIHIRLVFRRNDQNSVIFWRQASEPYLQALVRGKIARAVNQR